MFHKKQYACFFAALFALQMMFGLTAIFFDNSIEIQERRTAEEYDYHLVFRSLTIDQYYYLENYGGAITEDDRMWEVVRSDEYGDSSLADITYDAYVRFTGDNIDYSFERFRMRTLNGMAETTEDGVRYAISPAFNNSTAAAANNVYRIIALVFVTVLSVAVLTSLYYIRMSHYKFTYGIYSTFGADVKKLMQISFWEFMTVCAVTLIPSIAASAGVGWFILHLCV